MHPPHAPAYFPSFFPPRDHAVSYPANFYYPSSHVPSRYPQHAISANEPASKLADSSPAPLETEARPAAGEMISPDLSSGVVAPLINGRNQGCSSSVNPTPSVGPAQPSGPPPLTLRDFLQLLGESVAVLEGVRLLLLQLLQWGGEVGSLLRSSLFFQKIFSLVSTSLSRLVRLPFALLYFLFGRTWWSERNSLSLAYTTQEHDGDGRLRVLNRAWKEALLPAAAASGLPVVSTALGMYSGKADHGFVERGTDRCSKSRSAGWLDSMRSLSSSRWQPRGPRGSRIGMLVYAALVFGVAYRLRSLWKKYRRLLSDYRAVLALVKRQRAAAAAAEQAVLERERERGFAERQRLLASFFQSFRARSSSPFSLSSDTSRGHEVDAADRAAVDFLRMSLPSRRLQASSAVESAFSEERTKCRSDRYRSSSPGFPHLSVAISASSSSALPSLLNEPSSQNHGSSISSGGSLAELSHRQKDSSSTCSSTQLDQGDRTRPLPTLICDELEAKQKIKRGSHLDLLSHEGKTSEGQLSHSCSNSLSRDKLSSSSSSTKAPSTTNTPPSTSPRILAEQLSFSSSSCRSLAPSFCSSSSSSSSCASVPPHFPSACDPRVTSSSVPVPSSCVSRSYAFSAPAFPDTSIVSHESPLQPQKRFGAEERLSEPLFDDNPFLALVSSEICQERDQRVRVTYTWGENLGDGESADRVSGVPRVPSHGPPGSTVGTGVSSGSSGHPATAGTTIGKSTPPSGDETLQRSTDQAGMVAAGGLCAGDQVNFSEILAPVRGASRTPPQERRVTESCVTADLAFLPSDPSVSSVSRRLSFCSTVPSVSSSCASFSSSAVMCATSLEPPTSFPLSSVCPASAAGDPVLSRPAGGSENAGEKKTGSASTRDQKKRSVHVSASEPVTLRRPEGEKGLEEEDSETVLSSQGASTCEVVARGSTNPAVGRRSARTRASRSDRPTDLPSSSSGGASSGFASSGCVSAVPSASSCGHAPASPALSSPAFSDSTSSHSASDFSTHNKLHVADGLPERRRASSLRLLSAEGRFGQEGERNCLRAHGRRRNAAQSEEGKVGYQRDRNIGADRRVPQLRFPGAGSLNACGGNGSGQATGATKELAPGIQRGRGRTERRRGAAMPRDARHTESGPELWTERKSSQSSGHSFGKTKEPSRSSEGTAGSREALTGHLAVCASSACDTASCPATFAPATALLFPPTRALYHSSVMGTDRKSRQDTRDRQSSSVSLFSAVS